MEPDCRPFQKFAYFLKQWGNVILLGGSIDKIIKAGRGRSAYPLPPLADLGKLAFRAQACLFLFLFILSTFNTLSRDISLACCKSTFPCLLCNMIQDGDTQKAVCLDKQKAGCLRG